MFCFICITLVLFGLCPNKWTLFTGVTGLYRGISSNIASSAPISAVYTFTYESVKGALLPLLPKVILHLKLFSTLYCYNKYVIFSFKDISFAFMCRNTILLHIARQVAVLVLLLHLFLLLVSALSSRCKLVHAIRTVGITILLFFPLWCHIPKLLTFLTELIYQKYLVMIMMKVYYEINWSSLVVKWGWYSTTF